MLGCVQANVLVRDSYGDVAYPRDSIRGMEEGTTLRVQLADACPSVLHCIFGPVIFTAHWDKGRLRSTNMSVACIVGGPAVLVQAAAMSSRTGAVIINNVVSQSRARASETSSQTTHSLNQSPTRRRPCA